MQQSAVVISFLLVYGAIAQSLHWQERTPSDSVRPPARKGSAIAWTPTAIYLFGGENRDGALGDMWKFSLLDSRWIELRHTRKPAPRHSFVAGAFEDFWIISHGKGSDTYDDTWIFDFTSEEWSVLNSTQNTPESRYSATGGAAIRNDDNDNEEVGLLWLSMGINGVKRKLSDTWILTVNLTDPQQSEWQKVSNGVGLNQYDPSLPHARAMAAGMGFSNGHFILVGGCSSGGQVGGPCPQEDSWIYRSSGWTRLKVCPIPAHSSSMVPLNSHILDIGVLYGGSQGSEGFFAQAVSSTSLSADELTLFNITSLKWSRIRINRAVGDIPTGRSSPHMAPSAQGIYMFGGEAVGNNELLNDLWLLETAGGGIPESLSCSYTWFSLLHLHGILMYIAWGLFLPLGAMMGRYYRWTWPVWFVVHVLCQVFGIILTIGGFVVVFLVASEPSHPHGVIGIILMISVVQQFLSGLIRPWLAKEDGRFVDECKDKDTFKYKWRRCWEVYHRVSGIIAIGIGFTQVTLGVFLIDAPVPVWAVWLVLLCIWLAIFMFHEIIHCFCIRLHKE